MDNGASDQLLPTRFTEMWFPMDRTPEVMAGLRDHYDRDGFRATGAYACEIYATKRRRFWMYPQFWNLLKDLDYRLHWGKYLPQDSAMFLPARYRHWNDFLALRQRLDPAKVFLAEYWRKHLGVQ